MKRHVTSAVTALLLICLLLAQVAQAAEPRAATGAIDLSFDGNTAVCSAICRGNSTSDELDVTLTLYQGSTVIDSWSDSGKWSITLTGEHKVTSGKSYRLELTYSINGVKQSAVTTTSTCP